MEKKKNVVSNNEIFNGLRLSEKQILKQEILQAYI